MADYNINLTIQNIWSVFRVVIDIAIMWFIIYYAIKAIRNNSRTIQIFKGIIAIIAVNGLAKLLGLSTLTYFTDMFINWGLLAFIIIVVVGSMISRTTLVGSFLGLGYIICLFFQVHIFLNEEMNVLGQCQITFILYYNNI